MAEKKYDVIRYHIGDKEYHVGDTRTANPAEVGHLIGLCLEEQKEKKAPASKNKAAPAAKNKAAD